MPIDQLISLSILAGYLHSILAIGSIVLFVILLLAKRRWNQPAVGALLFVLPGMYVGVYSLGLLLGESAGYTSGAFYAIIGEAIGYLLGWSLFALFARRGNITAIPAQTISGGTEKNDIPGTGPTGH
jgi:hypothetical protein